MSGTNNLGITEIAENQASPEVPINNALGRHDAALTETFAADLSAGNVSVTSTQYREAIFIRAYGVATSGRTLTLPAVERALFLVECDSANTNTISLIVGSTTLTLSPGRLYLVRTDGTTNGVVARDIAGVSEPSDHSVFVPGTMSNAQVLYRRKVLRAFTLPANLAGSFVTAITAATGSTVLTVKKNGTGVATATFAASGTTATLATSGGTAQTFAVGDVFTIEAPATADATLADTTLDLFGTR